MKDKTYKKLYRVLSPILRFIFRVKITGAENEPEENTPVLVCSNHISMVDPIIISASLRHRQVRYMAKKELFGIPVVAAVVRTFGAYPVDRKNADAGALKKTIEMLKGGESVGMFPQGTRRPGVDPSDTKVRPGAGMICSRSGAAVLPVHIKTKNYKFRLFRKTEVIIGKPIPYEKLISDDGAAKEYGMITKKIFDEILSLGSEK